MGEDSGLEVCGIAGRKDGPQLRQRGVFGVWGEPDTEFDAKVDLVSILGEPQGIEHAGRAVARRSRARRDGLRPEEMREGDGDLLVVEVFERVTDLEHRTHPCRPAPASAKSGRR